MEKKKCRILQEIVIPTLRLAARRECSKRRLHPWGNFCRAKAWDSSRDAQASNALDPSQKTAMTYHVYRRKGVERTAAVWCQASGDVE